MFQDSFQRFDMARRSGPVVGHPTQRYPSPFFDIAGTYLPQSIKHMFRWCTQYYLTTPIIAPIVTNLAEYPITPIIVHETDTELKQLWEELIENQFQIRSRLIEIGIDYFTYGNAFISMFWPFEKYLQCKQCKFAERVDLCRYKFKNLEFKLTCKQCGIESNAEVQDRNIKALKRIKIIRWNPEDIELEHNNLTGHTDYFLTIPQNERNDIMMGKRHVIETIPNIYIECLKKQQRLKFTEGELFHFKRPTLSFKDQGWGMPLILPVLKSGYYMQVLRKAQEAIMNGCIIPLRILFPQAGDAVSSPYTNVNLGNWTRRIEGELEKWRRDPNYIPVMPLPVGNEIVGAEGKTLTLFQELQILAEEICTGMGVPIEFYKGGLSWTGSNISMRMLQNKFHSYRVNQLILVRDFILGRIADYMDWVRPKVSFERFRMADDLQRSALLFQLNQAMKISDTTLLQELDLDVDKELELMKKEMRRQLQTTREMQIAQAQLQADVGLIQAKGQVQAQKKMTEMGMPPPVQEGQGGQPDLSAAIDKVTGAASETGGNQVPAPGSPPGGGADQPQGVPDGTTLYQENAQDTPQTGIPTAMQSPLQAQGGAYNLAYVAKRAANMLKKMDLPTRQTQMMDMKNSNPDLFKFVAQIINDEVGSQVDATNPLQAPLPEQKPPRRKLGIA